MDREDLIIAIIKETREDVKNIQADMSVMKVDVELNRKDLELHMKRSDKIEQLVELKQREVDAQIAAINQKLTVGYLLKLIVTVAGSISAISAAIYGVMRLL